MPILPQPLPPQKPLPPRLWFWLLTCGSGVIVASLIFSILQIRTRDTELLREGARNIFRTIVAVQQWHASTQGVFVATDEPTSAAARAPCTDALVRPAAPGQTWRGPTGVTLHRLDASWMTCQISRFVGENSTLNIHLTSLTPLPAQKAADAWETQALQRLADGADEVAEMVRQPDGTLRFRYLAPLHPPTDSIAPPVQRDNDVLNGSLSILLPFAPVEAGLRHAIILSSANHLFALGLLGAVCFLLRERSGTLQPVPAADLGQREKMASLERMLAGLARALHTPISEAADAITACVQTVPAVPDEPPSELVQTMQTYAHHALRRLHRASSLIRGVSEFSPAPAHEAQLNFDLGELIESVLQEKKSLYVSCARIEVLCPPGTRITSQPGLLDQVLGHLITNSVTHGFRMGQRPGNIRIEVQPSGAEAVLISFADDGVGMPPEVLSRVFEPFFSPQDGETASGMGLYICYTLITTRLGGSIRCDSLPDGGTHFLLTLPISLTPPAAFH